MFFSWFTKALKVWVKKSLRQIAGKKFFDQCFPGLGHNNGNLNQNYYIIPLSFWSFWYSSRFMKERINFLVFTPDRLTDSELRALWMRTQHIFPIAALQICPQNGAINFKKEYLGNHLR